MEHKWHQIWYIRILFFVGILLLGFIIGFHKGEKVYNYSIRPFVNTKGIFDLSILWSAIAGIATFVISGIAIWLNSRIHMMNQKNNREKQIDNLALYRKKLLNDINNNISDIKFSVNISAIEYEVDKGDELDKRRLKNEHINKYIEGTRDPLSNEDAEALKLNREFFCNINQNSKIDIIFSSHDILYKILIDSQIKMYDYVFSYFKKINANKDNLNCIHNKKLEFGVGTPQEINLKEEKENIKQELSYNILTAYGLIEKMNDLTAVIEKATIEELV